MRTLLLYDDDNIVFYLTLVISSVIQVVIRWLDYENTNIYFCADLVTTADIQVIELLLLLSFMDERF